MSPKWKKQGCRIARGTEHGYEMILDLKDYFQRETYYLGQYYEWEIQALIRSFLTEGDTFIDVGANIGMLTLSAAAAVGEQGTVLSFEPNPEARTHLQMHINMNGLKQVCIFSKGLSFEQSSLTLRISGDSSDVGTLLPICKHVDKSFEIETARLDDYIELIPEGRRVLLKIDTEGYDFRVIRGSNNLLTRQAIIVVAEVYDEFLKELGESWNEMYGFMKELGYEAFMLHLKGLRLRHNLDLVPVSSSKPPKKGSNVLFIRESELELVHK